MAFALAAPVAAGPCRLVHTLAAASGGGVMGSVASTPVDAADPAGRARVSASRSGGRRNA